MSGVRITIKPPLSDAIRVTRGVRRHLLQTSGVWWLRKDSIRCREGRTAERPIAGIQLGTGPTSFYLLSRGAYSGTAPGTCRPFWTSPRRFYSLSRGAYSGTRGCVQPADGRRPFLFAVARGVQRNGSSKAKRFGFPFLFAVARGVQRNVAPLTPQGRRSTPFLFAVARGVQRNPTMTPTVGALTRSWGFYSL